MIKRNHFSAAILYLAGQGLAGLVRPAQASPATQADGEQDGALVHRYVTVDRTIAGRTTDVTFHYVEAGPRDRECIVFLHGFMDTWRAWRRQLESFANRYRVIAIDLKGTGQSSKNYPQALFPEVNDPGGDYTLEMQAEELMTALQRIGVSRFNLVTLDLGTIIGDILAGLDPVRVLRYMRCQQPLVGHFASSIRQGRILRNRRGARIFTAMLEASPAALLRILYGRTGWPFLDRSMKRTRNPMPDDLLRAAVQEASHPFPRGPRIGKPAAFACAWAGLYQHNRSYMRFLRDNLDAYRKYEFPVLLVQGTHDIAMPADRFDGSTGMAFKTVRAPFWMRSPSVQTIVLSRPFTADGQGIGDGYLPWAGLIPDCDRPLRAEEFFPNATSVRLAFIDAGHFIPLEAGERLDELLHEFLAVELDGARMNGVGASQPPRFEESGLEETR